MALTAKQKDFVQYYEDIASLSRHNASASYAEAYNRPNDATARANGARLITKANIKQAIAEYGQELADKVNVKREEIIQALRQLAGLDKQVKGDIKPNNGERLRSLELLGKTLVMFADKVVTEQAEEQALTETEHAEAQRLARLRLLA